jgi:tetratricopeptide (TPR) repeat protein
MPLVLLLSVLGTSLAPSQETEPPTVTTLQEDSAVVQDDAAVQEAFERGLRQYRNRGFRPALEELNKVVAMKPDRADAHYLIGYCHLMVREYGPALEAFRRCFDEMPNFDPRTIYQKPKPE